MTISTTHTDVSPPEHYPYPEWAPEGPYFVPAELRGHYARSQPSPVEQRGYWQYGAEEWTVMPGLPEAGDDVVVVGEGGRVGTVKAARPNGVRRLEGPAGYGEWLHGKRLSLARSRRESQLMRERMEAQRPTCGVCGARVPSLEGVWSMTFQRDVSACWRCLGVLAVEVERLGAEQVLPDGRTRRQAAAEYAAQLVAGGGAR